MTDRFDYRSAESDATSEWIRAIVRAEVKAQAAFLATVDSADGHAVTITRSTSEGVPGGTFYASSPTFVLSPGDLVLCQPVGGEPIIVGRVSAGEPAGETLDVATLDITGDLTVDGTITTLSGMDATSITGGPFLPTMLGTGTPQLGMYLEGNGAWSYPTISEGPIVRPGIQLANLSTGATVTAGQTIAHYLGQTIEPVAQAVLTTNIITAYAAGTGGTPWAEVGIATGTPVLGGAATLTMAGWTSVATIFNATGAKTATVSGMAIPAHSHIWILWGSQGGTTGGVAYAPLVGIAEPVVTGMNQFKVTTRPSTMSGAQAFGGFSSAGNQAWWAAQLS